MQKGSIKTIH